MSQRSLAEVLAGAAVLLVAALFLAYALASTGRAGGGGQTLTARFDRADGLSPGSEVRVAGVRVGRVTGQRVDPATFLAVLTLEVDRAIRLPDDSSAEITSEGLLGGRYVALVPGGSERILADGGEIRLTQSSISLESLLGRFLFSGGELGGNAAGEGEPPRPTP